jgi:hypothetical protein
MIFSDSTPLTITNGFPANILRYSLYQDNLALEV